MSTSRLAFIRPLHESRTAEAMLDGIEGDAIAVDKADDSEAIRSCQRNRHEGDDPFEAQPRSDLDILRRSLRCRTRLLCVLSVGSQMPR